MNRKTNRTPELEGLLSIKAWAIVVGFFAATAFCLSLVEGLPL